MIVGRDYILQSLRNQKAYRPETNALAAVLKAYTRPVSGIGDYLFKLESYLGSGTEFLFKHLSTGYYLTEDSDAPGSSIKITALVGSGSSAQRWTIQGNDPSARVSSVQSASSRQISLLSDSDGASASMQPYSGIDTNEILLSFGEYSATPSGLVAPTLKRIFRNFTACDVIGVAEGATVKVYVDDVLRNTVTGVTGGSTSVYLGALQLGQKITTEQTLNTITSEKSAVQYVQELSRVWKEGYTGSFQWRAYKVTVTSVPDQDNLETIVGTKGEPIGSYRASYELALADATNAGLTETTY